MGRGVFKKKISKNFILIFLLFFKTFFFTLFALFFWKKWCMTLWILSPFSASYTTCSIFTNCFLQRYYVNTLYRQFKQMRYSSLVKVNIICFCRIGHTTSQFFAFFFYKGGKNGGNIVCSEGSLHGKRDIRSALRCNFSSFSRN